MKVNLIHAIILEPEYFDEGMDFDEAECGDYIVHAIYDLESENCIFHDDNIHNDPSKFLEGVEAGVDLLGASLDIEEVVLFVKEGESPYNYIDVCHAIRRWIAENLD